MKFNYYKITNIKNNKIYIGITEKETSERIKQHFSRLRNNCHNNYNLKIKFSQSFTNNKKLFNYMSITLQNVLKIFNYKRNLQYVYY